MHRAGLVQLDLVVAVGAVGRVVLQRRVFGADGQVAVFDGDRGAETPPAIVGPVDDGGRRSRPAVATAGVDVDHVLARRADNQARAVAVDRAAEAGAAAEVAGQRPPVEAFVDVGVNAVGVVGRDE